MLGIQFSPRYYGIPKSLDVPEGAFPIQFVDSANVTATPIVVGGPTAAAARGGGGARPQVVEAAAGAGEEEEEASAPSYLFPVDRVLRVPVGERERVARRSEKRGVSYVCTVSQNDVFTFTPGVCSFIPRVYMCVCLSYMECPAHGIPSSRDCCVPYWQETAGFLPF